MGDEREPSVDQAVPADGRPFRQPPVCVGDVVVVGHMSADDEGTPAIVTKVFPDTITASPVEEGAKNFGSSPDPIPHYRDPRARSFLDQNPDTLFWRHTSRNLLVNELLGSFDMLDALTKNALARSEADRAAARRAASRPPAAQPTGQPSGQPVGQPEGELVEAGI